MNCLVLGFITIDAVSKLDGEGFPILKHLNVGNGPEIEYILNSMDLTSTSTSPSSCRTAFPVMETLLSLNHLINLKQVCCHGRLRKVKVEDCNGLEFPFSLSVARELSGLEEISVSRCKGMVHIVCQMKEDDVAAANYNVNPLFPELRLLTLEELPKLNNILCFEGRPLLSNQLVC